MHWYFAAKILIFFFIELKEIFPAQATIFLENEITKPLDKWFASMFAIRTSTVDEIIERMHYLDMENFEYNSSNAENHVERKFFKKFLFSGLTYSSAQIDFTFSTNKLRSLYKEISFYIWSELHAKDDNMKKIVAFATTLTIQNASFNAFASSTSPNEPNSMITSRNISYSNMLAKFERVTSSSRLTEISNEEKDELKRDAFPLILNKHFINDPRVQELLAKTLSLFMQPRNELFSKHPELSSNPEQFYYLITKIPFFCFTLKCIIISGLSNLHTFKMEKSSDIFTHTLLIKNIEGSMILDYGWANESALKINFKIDDLFVMKQEETNCSCVHAKYWQITRAKVNISLNTRQSEVLMNALESAIASSVLPSMKVGKVCNIETRPELIKIIDSTDWKSVKDEYRGWIPFNDDTEDTIAAKLPFNVFNQ